MRCPSVRSSATSMLPSSTVPVIRPTAQMGSMSASVDNVTRRAPKLDDAARKMTRGMNAIGEQRPGATGREVDPKAGAGEAGMADGLCTGALATRPAEIRPLPSMCALIRERRAHQRAPLALEHTQREVEHGCGGAEQCRM